MKTHRSMYKLTIMGIAFGLISCVDLDDRWPIEITSTDSLN